jgi:hypothetical protein
MMTDDVESTRNSQSDTPELSRTPTVMRETVWRVVIARPSLVETVLGKVSERR